MTAHELRDILLFLQAIAVCAIYTGLGVGVIVIGLITYFCEKGKRI